jgi:demethylmenaquinone methyltransferase / 2-methoxy-6-polyprenyl-1,4-benzoquinol methylase
MIQQREAFAEQFFSGNAESYDRIARFSTLGLDAWWKRTVLAKIPANPRRILEQASGTGILTLQIARRFPDCRIVGVELQERYLAIARQKACEARLANVEFICGRAEEIIMEGPFDCIVSDYLAKYVDLDRLMAHAAKMLREGGALIMHELARPTNPLFAELWQMHFKFLQTYGRWKYPEWEAAFRDVPLLLAKSCWVEELSRALAENEFSDIEVERFFLGASVMVSARK